MVDVIVTHAGQMVTGSTTIIAFLKESAKVTVGGLRAFSVHMCGKKKIWPFKYVFHRKHSRINV